MRADRSPAAQRERRGPPFAVLSSGWALALLLAACSGGVRKAAPARGFPVVATFSVVGDLARQVGGDRIALTVLVGPGKDTHTYEPTPADGVTLTQAALVVENGLGFEPWLDRLYTASGAAGKRVAATAGLTLRHTPDGRPDPHVWHDISDAMQMVENIREALAQADPAHAGEYQARAEAFLIELRDLDVWARAQIQSLPPERRKLVTTHDTLGYFAARYGLEVVGALLPGSTEGASPSAQQMAALVEAVKAQGVPAVFAENMASNALLRQVAAEAGIQVVATLYTDALGPAGSEGDSYAKMMRYNVNTMVSALGP